MISIKTEYDMFAEITLAIDPKKRFVNSELQNSLSNVSKADNTILCSGLFIFLAETLR